MSDSLLRQINGLVYGALGADALAAFQAHTEGYTLGAGAALLLAVLTAAWFGWRWTKRRVDRSVRWLSLMRWRDGRRALARAAEIRRGCRRLRAAIVRSALDPRERRETAQLLDRFLSSELNQTLDTLASWLLMSRNLPSRSLQRQLDSEIHAWTALAAGGEKSRCEQRIAGLRQQIALGAQAAEDRAALLAGLDEAAAALRTLEAELLSLGQMRSQVLPRFRAELDDLAGNFRHQRLTHAEFRVRPG